MIPGRLVPIAAVAILGCMAGAHAAMAAPKAEFCKTGNLVVIRLSAITPNGSMAGFMKAAADNAKWYIDHGYPNDEVVTAPVKAPDGDAKARDRILTIHYRFHTVPASRQDPAWNAFVAEYRANSDIISEMTACFPK